MSAWDDLEARIRAEADKHLDIARGRAKPHELQSADPREHEGVVRGLLRAVELLRETAPADELAPKP